MGKSGFTLLELSIVLVIIGLIKYGKQIQEYQTAYQTFRVKYNQMPGDMNNATSYWGKDNVRCPGNPGVAATGGTCIGDGNGRVNESVNEIGNFWQHLGLAGMLPGTYDGIYVVGALSPGVSQPATPLGGGWITYSPNATAYYGVPAATRNQMQARSNAGSVLISTADAKSIDLKVDDGIAGSGRLVSYGGAGGTATSCADGPLAQTSPVPDYTLSNTAQSACITCWYLN
jgi:prepilin-type N-terminal cleavage/methylation domain-containing protein